MFNIALNTRTICVSQKILQYLKIIYKYLDYELFFNGNLTHTAEALYEKSLKALFSPRRKLNNFQDVPVKVQIKLFVSLIRPILNYGAELWMCDFTRGDR